MAYITGYQYDIFISYAHVDNKTISEKADGWIAQFYKNLNLMLDRRIGRSDIVNIWWDNKKLEGNVVFDQSIKDGINKSAIMICLNSNGYLASDYCKQELDFFYKKASQEKPGLKIGDRSRIFNVLLNNIPFTQWPAELSGTSGFPFNDAKEKTELGDPVDTLSAEFITQMKSIRNAIWNLIQEFPKDQPADLQKEPEKISTGKEAFTIYLGEVADTLRTPRKRIITELEKKGFTVLAGIPPPEEAVAHEKATNKALENASLAIHLLDEFPGREIEGDTNNWYTQKQTELSLKSGKSQMIWVPAETDFNAIEDEKYKLFMQSLEKGEASATGYEFVRGSKSTLAQEIIDYAEQVKAQQKQEKVVKDKISVLLDTHFSDQLYALDLSKILLENQIQPFINPQEDDPGKNINLMAERLSQVKKLIFLYGAVSKEWVLERMSAAVRLIINNNYPIEDFYIYMAPPHKENSNLTINQRFLKVNVVNCSEYQNIYNDELQQFLLSLKTSAA